MAIRLHVHTPIQMHFSKHQVTPKIGHENTNNSNVSKVHVQFAQFFIVSSKINCLLFCPRFVLIAPQKPQPSHRKQNRSSGQSVFQNAGAHSIVNIGQTASDNVDKQKKLHQKQQYAEVLRQQIELKLQIQKSNLEQQKKFDQNYHTPKHHQHYQTSQNNSHKHNDGYNRHRSQTHRSQSRSSPTKVQLYDFDEFFPKTQRNARGVKRDIDRVEYTNHNKESFSPNKHSFLSSISDMYNPRNKQEIEKELATKQQWKHDLEEQIAEKKRRKLQMQEAQRIRDLKEEQECQEYFNRTEMQRTLKNGETITKFKDIAPSPVKTSKGKKQKDTHQLDEAVSFIPREAPPQQSHKTVRFNDSNLEQSLKTDFSNVWNTKSTWVAPTVKLVDTSTFNPSIHSKNINNNNNSYSKFFNVSESPALLQSVVNVDAMLDDVFNETWKPQSMSKQKQRRIFNFDEQSDPNSDELDALLLSFVSKKN